MLIESGKVTSLEDARKKELKLYLHNLKPEMNLWQLERCAKIIYGLECHFRKEIITIDRVAQ